MVLFIVFALAGAFLGGIDGSPFLGAAIGFAIAWANQLADKIKDLQKQLEQQSQLQQDQIPPESSETHSADESIHPEQTDWLDTEPKTQPLNTNSIQTLSDSPDDMTLGRRLQRLLGCFRNLGWCQLGFHQQLLGLHC